MKHTKPSLKALFVAALFSVAANLAHGQCQGINFTASTTSVCAPAFVQFIATGYPAGSTFTWKFNNVQFSAGDTVTQMFLKKETLSVQLTVHTSSGSCVVKKDNYVQVHLPPAPTLTLNKILLCNGADDVILYNSTPGYSKIDWLVEGKSLVNLKDTLKYRFSIPGAQQIGLRVYDQHGCSTLKKFDSAIVVYNTPVMDIRVSGTQACSPVKARYSLFYSPKNRNILEYDWKFEKGNPDSSTQAEPLISYTKSDLYSAMVKVKMEGGCSYSRQQFIPVMAIDVPKPQFKLSDSLICQGSGVTLTNTTSKDTFAGWFSWSFQGADLTTDTTYTKNPIQLHYPDTGTFTVTLSTGTSGCTLQTSKQVRVKMIADTRYSTTNNPGCTVPRTVNFFNNVADTTGMKFTWNLYSTNGITLLKTSNNLHTSYTYTSLGLYPYELITFAMGCQQKQGGVVRLIKPKAKVKITQTICVGTGADFRDLTEKFDSAIFYKWIIWDRDGTTILHTDTQVSFSRVFMDTGYYNVTFIVYSKECSDTLRLNSAVHVTRTLANLAIKKSFFCAGSRVPLGDLLSGDSGDVTPPALYNLLFWKSDDSSVTITCSNCEYLNLNKPTGTYHVRYIGSNGGPCTDTLFRNYALSLSGMDGDMSLDKTYGCIPFSTNMRAVVKTNVHYGHPLNDTVRYNWTVYRNGLLVNSTMASCDPNIAISKLNIYEEGDYVIRLLMSNSDGCQSPLIEKTLYLNNKASAVIPAEACRDNSYKLTNESPVVYTQFKWSANSSIAHFSSLTAFEPILTFSDTGKVLITLEAKASDCMSTFSKWVTVRNVTLSFSSLDTVKKCAPAIVKFTAISEPGVSFSWDFGDGEFVQTEDKVVYHMYRKNTGSLTDPGYDVQVKATGPTGCTREASSTSYIKVIGPAPLFTADVQFGCEPLKVTFTDKSHNLTGHYFDPGDGWPVDSLNLGWEHTYYVGDPTAKEEIFTPILLAYDKDYCYSYYYGPNIKVYKKPEAEPYTTKRDVFCTNEPVILKDNSPMATKWKWVITPGGGGPSAGSNSNPGTFYLAPGLHHVWLEITSDKGCKDTLELSDILTVRDKPHASFQIVDSVVCLNRDAKFINTSYGQAPVEFNWWKFGENNGKDTSTEENPSYHYHATGLKNVSLRVQDIFGCKDTLMKTYAVNVVDSAVKQKPLMHFVSVGTGNKTEISWPPSGIPKFDHYRIYRASGPQWQLISKQAGIKDTNYTDASGLAGQSKVSYRLCYFNNCNNESEPSIVHTTIHPEVKSVKHAENILNWNSYGGWPVKEYRIYSSTDLSSGFKQIGLAKDTFYADYYICPKEIFYRVQAVPVNGPFRSLSSIPSGIPIYDEPVFKPTVSRVSVYNDRWVEIRCHDDSKKKWKGLYSLSRFEQSQGWVDDYVLTGSEKLLDKKTEVHEESYVYKARFRDTCGAVTAFGNIGTSILLKAKIVDDRPVLKWNAYEHWDQGVLHYLVQIYRDGRFRTIGEVPADSFMFTDEQVHPEIDTAYVYRVLAVSNGFADTSMSNTATATVGSRIWVPNAFTPDGDGLNDVFLPVLVGVYNEPGREGLSYGFWIYNLWGEELFYTNDIYTGWDGTFKGKSCPGDAYAYLIKATGIDKKKIVRAGSVQLLR